MINPTSKLRRITIGLLLASVLSCSGALAARRTRSRIVKRESPSSTILLPHQLAAPKGPQPSGPAVGISTCLNTGKGCDALGIKVAPSGPPVASALDEKVLLGGRPLPAAPLALSEAVGIGTESSNMGEKISEAQVVARPMSKATFDGLSTGVGLRPDFPSERIVWVVYVDAQWDTPGPSGHRVFHGYEIVVDARTHQVLATGAGSSTIDPNKLEAMPTAM